MRRLLALPVVLLAAVLPFTHLLFAQDKPRPPRKVALLVGPKTYLHLDDGAQLPHLDDDVNALAAELRKGGFDEVVVLTDPPEGKNPATGKNVRAQFDRLLSGGGDEVKKLRRDDVLLLVLSGHGQEHFVTKEQKHTFFVPADGKKKDPATWVDLSDLMDKLDDAKCRTLVLADMCRDIFDPNKGSKGVGLDPDSLKLPPNTAILFGCESTQSSFVNKELKHSLFTYAVLEVMAESRAAGKPLLWSGLVNGVEERFTGERFKKLMGDDKQQSPVERKRDLKATTLMTALSSAPTDETTEEFTWQGKKRTRTVRVLDLGREKVEFVKVPKGSFMMGSPESDKDASGDEKPRHKVTFTKDLWVAKYPTTKGQFAAFVKADGYKTEAEADGKGGWGYDGKEFKQADTYSWRNTGWEQTDKHPVVNVTWNDAEAYTKWASKASKQKVRLLTEAEYEYANRGGTDTVYITGDDVASLDGYANVGDQALKAKKIEARDKYPYFGFDDMEAFTSPVGNYKANGFGLHDTTGNVWSWCADWYDAKLYARGDVTDPKANADGEQKYRVLRGGSWFNAPVRCRAANRGWDEPAFRDSYVGFRVCFRLD